MARQNLIYLMKVIVPQVGGKARGHSRAVAVDGSCCAAMCSLSRSLPLLLPPRSSSRPWRSQHSGCAAQQQAGRCQLAAANDSSALHSRRSCVHCRPCALAVRAAEPGVWRAVGPGSHCAAGSCCVRPAHLLAAARVKQGHARVGARHDVLPVFHGAAGSRRQHAHPACTCVHALRMPPLIQQPLPPHPAAASRCARRC